MSQPATPPNRLDPRERYRRDVQFRAVVDTLYLAMVGCDYTFTELREALFLAGEKYAVDHPSPVLVSVTPGTRAEGEERDRWFREHGVTLARPWPSDEGGRG